MRTSDSIKAFSKAFVEAQAKMGNAKLNKENPHFRSKYADLLEIATVAKEALLSIGIGVFQSPGIYDSEAHVMPLTTRLIHGESGEWMEDTIGLPLDKATAQGAGSGITYERRYALASMCGLVADEDDDGNQAEKQSRQPNNAQRTTQKKASKSGPKEKAIAAIENWSACSKDKRVPAIESTLRLMTADRLVDFVWDGQNPLTDDEWKTVEAYVRGAIDDKIDFNDATQKETV
jgi:hypothetical protein